MGLRAPDLFLAFVGGVAVCFAESLQSLDVSLVLHVQRGPMLLTLSMRTLHLQLIDRPTVLQTAHGS